MQLLREWPQRIAQLVRQIDDGEAARASCASTPVAVSGLRATPSQ